MSEPDGANGGERDERKERVLHTRVPGSLDRQLKQRARNLGMSVSTVVRHVLLNTFGLVEDIVTDSTNIALSIAGQEGVPSREAAGDHERGQAATAAAVLGWQEAVLNLNAVCNACNAVLRKGSRGAIGIRERPGPPAVLCPGCLGRLTGTGERGPARRQRGG